MKPNHSFILKPLAVSCFVAMTATGCAIDDDVDVAHHANLIKNTADPSIIRAEEEAKRKAEEEAKRKAEEEAKRKETERLEKERQEAEAKQKAQQAALDKISKARQTVDNANSTLTQAQKTTTEAQSQASNPATADNAINQANVAYQQANTALNNAETALVEAEQALKDAKAIGANQDIINQAQKAVEDAKQAINTAENVRTQAQNARKQAERTKSDNASQQIAKQIEKANAQTNEAVATANTAKAELNNADSQAEQAKTQAGNPDTAQSAIDQAKKAEQTAQNALDKAQEAVKQAQTALDTAKATGNQEAIKKAQDALNNANDTAKKATDAKEKAEAVIAQAQSTLDKYQAEQDNQNNAKIKQIKDTATGIANTANTLISNLDNTKKTADNAAKQANALITTDQALKDADTAKTQAVDAEQKAQKALTDAQKALTDAKAVSANNEAVTATQNAIKKAEEALASAQAIKKQTEAVSKQVETTEAKAYVAPISDDTIKKAKPDHTRKVNDSLVKAQPTPAQDTMAGYSSMDRVSPEGEFVENKTNAFYGVNQNEYAKKITELKTSIDTTKLSVGVIDSGISPDNPDLAGAKLSGNNLVACSNYDCFMNLPYMMSKPKDSHGSNMAAIIAGNNGMTNATIYSYTDGDLGNGDEFVAMHKLNKDQGVKIFNNSWGYIPEPGQSDNGWLEDAMTATPNGDTKNSPYKEVQSIHELIIENDALLIHATGNENKNNTFGERLIPKLNPDFKKGFLAVSAPREDFVEANYCGDAAEWCLSATSTTSHHNNDGTEVTYQGTSPATARVTGAALLVKGAYPWMKNENLVQALLSTAQDFDDLKARNTTFLTLAEVKESEINPDRPAYDALDDKGNKIIVQAVDTPWQNRTIVKNIGGKNITHESGWGLLDTIAATQGYGGFYWDNIMLDVTGKDTVSVFSNNIKGNYGFTKAGDGKLVLTGNNTYKGDTVITDGTLEINGDNGNSVINITGGELTGFGTTGNVRQTGGAVNNEGNLTIRGTYTMNNDSTFKAKFGNLLTVTEKATLDGTLDLYDEVKQSEPLIKETGSKTTVLRAGELSGTFDTVKSSNALFSIIKTEYSGKVGTDGKTTPDATTKTDVVVSAKRNKLSNMGSSSTASIGRTKVEQNLDKVLSEIDAKDSAGTLAGSEKGFAIGFANKMSMATNKSLLSTSGTPAIIGNKYNEALFGLDPAFYANNAVHAIEQSGTQATNFAKNMANTANGVWLESTYQEYELDLPSSQSEREVRNQSIGVAKTGERFGLGLQLDLGRLELDEQNGSTNHNIETDVATLTVGVNSDVGNNAKGTLWAKAGVLNSNAKNNTHNKQKYNGQLYAGGVHLGTSYALSPNASIKPYIGVSYHQYQHDNAHFDDGVVAVKDIDATRWQGTIGVDTEYQINPQWQVQAGLQYDNAFEQDATIASAYSGTNTDVTFDAWETGKDKIQATVGTSYQIDPRNRVSLDYDYFKSEKSDGDRVQLTLSSRF
ncbi:S8 family serine peptidase [Moraxella bovis]|uniref:Extracellular serine protease n=1 Tax=Moraxella bovis TaxID=476 RepID=A0A378PNL5_MORBO|nr:S8 family serine peptidase [Moraxella bovis]STY90166.1 Extracellular serine protease precursor [Moraxella bovis]